MSSWTYWQIGTSFTDHIKMRVYTAVLLINVNTSLEGECIKLPGCRGTETNLTECNNGSLVTEAITDKRIAGVICREFEQELTSYFIHITK